MSLVKRAMNLKAILFFILFYTGGLFGSTCLFATLADSLKAITIQEDNPDKLAKIYAELSRLYPDDFDSTLHFSTLFLHSATQSTDTILIADAYYQMAETYYYNNFDSTLHYAILYLDKVEKSGKNSWIAYGHDLLAYAYSEKGEIKASLEEYRKALEYFTLAGDSSRMAASNVNIGYTLSFGREQAAGLNYFLRGLKLAESIGDTTILSDAYFNVAYYFYRTKDYEASYNYYLQSLKLSQEYQRPDSGGIALTYALLAQVSLKRKLTVDFEAYMLQSKQLIKHVGSTYDLVNLFSSYLENYLEAQEIDSCIHYLQTVENILKNNSFKLLEAYTLQHKGRLLLLQKSYIESIRYLQQSIELFNQQKSMESFSDTYTYIARAYAAMHQYQHAYTWQLMANSLLDSLNLGAVERILTEFEQNKIFEAELNRKELEMKLKQQQLDNDKMQYRTRSRFLLALVISMLIFIAATIFYYRSIRKNNFLLLEQKSIIEQQKTQLEARNLALSKNEQRLNELNATKDKFFSIIAHDLRNPFTSIIGLSDMLLNSDKTIENERNNKITESIHKTASFGFNLLENLLEWSKSQTGKLSVKPEIINSQGLLNELIDDFKELSTSKHINIHLHIQSEGAFYADRNMITTILRNLLHNAIKFSYEYGKIEVQVEEKKQQLFIRIKDYGIGISESSLPHLFSIEKQTVKPGTMMEKGSGLGLILCKEFVEKNKGRIWVESKQNEGTCFTLSFPLIVP